MSLDCFHALFMGMEENDISYRIRGAIFAVYNHFGPGLLETIYEKALALELEEQGLKVQTQVTLPIIYRGVKLEGNYRLDILVEDKVIVEVKSVDELHDVHKKQLLSYLRLSQLKLGILVNFNTNELVSKKSIIRIINTREPNH